MGRYSRYAFGLSYFCKLDVSNFRIISKLVNIDNIEIYITEEIYGDKIQLSTSMDINARKLCAMDEQSVTYKKLLSCIINLCDADSYDETHPLFLVFFYNISSFESTSGESNDLYHVQQNPIEYMSNIKDGIEQFAECGVPVDDIKCKHYGSEWN